MKATHIPLLATAIFASGLLQQQADAATAYLRSSTGEPWGSTSNVTAMNTAFGAGNWSGLHFQTADATTLFSTDYTFIFLDGSDAGANALETFLDTNSALIASWVDNGGSLFLNSAPNVGDGMSFGFGVSLNYGGFFSGTATTSSGTATTVDVSHAIFLGPHGATGTSFTGASFSHATVSGGGITPLITGSAGTILAEVQYGNGHVLFGGMTTTNFHSPQPGAANLRANILAYGASQVIPEPSATLLVGAGAFVLAFGHRRRKE